MEKLVGMEDRTDFDPVYLLNFVAVAFLVAWTIVAGPRHRSVAVRRIADVVIWLFTLRFLQLLGRHSLHVYVWHVAIVYAVHYVDQRTPPLSQFTKTVIAFTGVALLALPALWREREHYLGARRLPAGQAG